MKVLLLIIILGITSYSQTSSNFNINLQLDFTSAEQTIALAEGQHINTQTLAELRGNRIAALTAELIAKRSNISSSLREYLDSLKYYQRIKDDVFNLEQVQRNVSDIKELVLEMKKRNFGRQVSATVVQIFPQDINIDITIPVYVVVLGHKNVSAYVRRIYWSGDNPHFTGNQNSELTIIINAASFIYEGDDLQERFLSLLGVVAHELFHVAFETYKENSPNWQEYYQKYQHPFYTLLDLTQNEGIAYYISLDQQSKGHLPRDWNEKTKNSIEMFNKACLELLSDTISLARVREILQDANLGELWENYGSITGMVIARAIDIHLGRKYLIESISKTPIYFFNQYIQIARIYPDYPTLHPIIEQTLNK